MSLCLQHKPRHKKHANKNTSLGEEIAWCVLAAVLERLCLYFGAGKGQLWCEAALLMAAWLALPLGWACSWLCLPGDGGMSKRASAAVLQHVHELVKGREMVGHLPDQRIDVL